MADVTEVGDGGNPATPPGNPPEKKFSQDELNRVVATERRKLEDKHKADAEAAKAAAEKAALESQSEYKKLYEAEQLKTAGLEARVKVLEMDGIRTKIGIEFSLPPELVTRLRGDTEEEVRADAEKLAAIVPNKQAEDDTQPPPKKPGTPPGNNGNTKPPKVGDDDKKATEKVAGSMRGAYRGVL